MSVALITGSAGLIGSEASRHFSALGLDVVGIDNDMRSTFFGQEASTAGSRQRLISDLGSGYKHVNADIRDRDAIRAVFAQLGSDIAVVIHTAAQPSHDWAAREPFTDFDINAGGTVNLLESTRQHCPEAPFIYTSTNKVYGDTPNDLPFVEMETRYEIADDHPYFGGIREDMRIDSSLHSIFGASKVAADVMVQEYGRYFGLRTVCFRGGTLTGPGHAATELHGFLAYVMRCCMTGRKYNVYGYKGKQVRDAIHSADLISAFEAFFRRPGIAKVYNIGGGRSSNASVREAMAISEQIVGREMVWDYSDANRVGDHMWWIGSNQRFQQDYPAWEQNYNVEGILREIYHRNLDSWVQT